MVYKDSVVEPDTTMAFEMVKGGAAGIVAALAQCVMACCDDLVMPSDKDALDSYDGAITVPAR
jgi:hypothetical protein